MTHFVCLSKVSLLIENYFIVEELHKTAGRDEMLKFVAQIQRALHYLDGDHRQQQQYSTFA